MTEPIRQRLLTVLFVLLCGMGALYSMVQIRGWNNDLSDVDRYSEANALREVRNFLEQGLTRHHGLGNVYYPGLYPEDGFAREPDIARFSVTPDGVYTHYPPGPEYLLYAAAKLMGSEPVSRLRLLPIATGWASMLFLGFAVRRRFGDGVGWLVMGTLALTPAVTDGFVGLHYQGYAAALLMLEIGFALRARASMAPFAILGFFQGWLSFDYAFLVALVPLAMEVAMPRIESGYEPRWRRAMAQAVLAGGGFALAHGLHFLQVWAYWGSLEATLRDFGGAAAHRAGSELAEGAAGYLLFALSTMKLYFYGLHPLNLSLTLPEAATPESWSMFRFFGLSLGPWWLLVTLGLVVWDAYRPNAANRSLRGANQSCALKRRRPVTFLGG